MWESEQCQWAGKGGCREGREGKGREKYFKIDPKKLIKLSTGNDVQQLELSYIYILLVLMQNCSDTFENSLTVSYKIKHGGTWVAQ